jgi:uncharacterized protein
MPTSSKAAAPAPSLSNTTAAFRKLGGFQDTDDNAADFYAHHPKPRNTSYEDEAPEIVSVYPADGTDGAPQNVNIIITFSEPVDVTAPWYSISCSISGAHTAAISGGPISFTLDPVNDFTSQETCEVTVFANQVSDQDLLDPPDTMEQDYTWSFTVADVCELPYTPIYEIQGSGPSTPIPGQVVSTQWHVVIGDYEGPSPNLRGFYIQDQYGDGDPTTSDGIFVFNGNNDSVSLGELIWVNGTAGEFQGQTQISNVTTIAVCGEGSLEPVDVTLPFPDHRLPRALRRHARAPAPDPVRHRALPARTIRPGRDVLLGPALPAYPSRLSWG